MIELWRYYWVLVWYSLADLYIGISLTSCSLELSAKGCVSSTSSPKSPWLPPIPSSASTPPSPMTLIPGKSTWEWVPTAMITSNPWFSISFAKSNRNLLPIRPSTWYLSVYLGIHPHWWYSGIRFGQSKTDLRKGLSPPQGRQSGIRAIYLWHWRLAHWFRTDQSRMSCQGSHPRSYLDQPREHR